MSAAPPSRDPERIEAMFDRIVPHYDLMNRLMTAGLDRRWRAAAAEAAAARPQGPLLDVCCGTGDLALALARRYPGVPVTALDFSEAMLERARLKAARAGAVVEFVHGDLLALPFADDTFSAVTVGWGVRNVADLPRAFAEAARVAAPGGAVVCLEATRPAGCGRPALSRHLVRARGAGHGRARHRRRRGLRVPARVGALVPRRRRPGRRHDAAPACARCATGGSAWGPWRCTSAGCRREALRCPVVALGRPAPPGGDRSGGRRGATVGHRSGGARPPRRGGQLDPGRRRQTPASPARLARGAQHRPARRMR